MHSPGTEVIKARKIGGCDVGGLGILLHLLIAALDSICAGLSHVVKLVLIKTNGRGGGLTQDDKHTVAAVMYRRNRTLQGAPGQTFSATAWIAQTRPGNTI